MSHIIYRELVEKVSKVRKDRIPCKPLVVKDSSKYLKYYADKFLSELTFGKFVVFQQIQDDNMYYPQMGVYVNSSLLDMAVCHSILEPPRSWMYHTEIKSDDYEYFISDFNMEVKDYVNWGSSIIKIFAIYDKKPNWKELKEAFEKTMWYELTDEQERNRAINRILK